VENRSDQDLLKACRKGDHHAWELIIDRYGRLVYSIPLNYGLSSEDAADISQISFTILFQSLDRIRDEDRLGGWLATVAKRHTWRHIKKHSREKPNEEEDLAADPFNLPDHSTKNQLERWELLEWLHHGLSLLGKRCQRLLTMLYFQDDGQSYEQISQELDIALGSIGPTRARCLQKLRKALTEQERTS
jgi:RNA polymerase sigma factor (sigma-70 family)